MRRGWQQGAALITALLIVGLSAAIAAALLSAQSALIKASQQVTRTDQLVAYLDGAIYWAADTILQSLDHGRASGRFLNNRLGPKRMSDGVEISAHLVDAQAQLNLNAVADKSLQPYFHKLLVKAGSAAPNEQLKQIAAYITSDNKLDAQYEQLVPSYRPPHQPMQNKTELRAVVGVSATLYRQLSPWVAALPTQVKTLNINTVSPTLLQLFMGDDAVDAVVACRSEKAIRSAGELTQCRGIVVPPAVLKRFGFHTQTFLVYATARLNQRRLHMTAMLYLHTVAGKKQPQVSVLWERLS